MAERPKPITDRLMPETKALLQNIENQTGHQVEVRLDHAIRERGRAIYVVTDPNSEHHLVLVDPFYEQYLDHLVAHEAGHIIRFAESEPDSRLVPVFTGESVMAWTRQLLPEITSLVAKGLPAHAVGEVMPIWISGMVAQLSDTPSDINIECWIHDELPALRHIQEASLLNQIQTLHLVMLPSVAAVTPKSVFLASNAINYTLVHEVAAMLRRPDLLRPYRNTKAEEIGDLLLGLVSSGSSSKPSLASEREVSQLWAGQLGFSSWFEWRSLDSLPQNYRHAWE